MSFWDRFVLAVYLSMADSVPSPRSAAGRIFEVAHQRGRFQLGSLNHLSLLLLLACLPPGRPLRQAVEAEAIAPHRPQSSLGTWMLLRDMRLPRLTDLLEVGRVPLFDLRGPVLNLVFDEDADSGEVLVNLSRFLGRLYGDAPEAQLPQAVRMVHQALETYYRMVEFATLDFLAVLYRHVLTVMRRGGRPLAEEWRECPLPVRRLRPVGRVLLALQLDAHLNVEQLPDVLRGTDERWTHDLVAQRLEQSWAGVL